MIYFWSVPISPMCAASVYIMYIYECVCACGCVCFSDDAIGLWGVLLEVGIRITCAVASD